MAHFRRLEEAATSGDINKLYEAIQQDPRILEELDAIPFENTPLHIAASAGHARFAIEIMRLKPSFALKLNQQGFSPIHIALQNNHHNLVRRLVQITKDLVRVKGKEGLTPLHFVCQCDSEENIKLLIDFLGTCPDSIKDVNVRNETALHIALRYGNFRALRELVSWLERNFRKGSRLLEKSTLNRKDEDGNTILHISALTGNRQAVNLLIKRKMMNNNAKNLENKTALDLAGDSPIQSILKDARAEHGASIHVPSHIKKLIGVILRKAIPIRRARRDISAEQRDAYMVVAGLIVTTIYQATLSPPGGLQQAGSWATNLNAISFLNSTATVAPGKAGMSVLPASDFVGITMLNTMTLLLTVVTIVILMPSGWVGLFLGEPLVLFTVSYILSVMLISPPGTMRILLGTNLGILIPIIVAALFDIGID